MSEIRSTTTVEAVETANREPFITLADILSAMGVIAFHGTKLAVNGAILGGKLACKAVKAGSEMYREHQLHMREIESTVHSAESARDAVESLAATPGFEVPVSSAEPFKAKLEALVAKNDKVGVVALAKQLRRDSQDRLQSNLMKLTAESCMEIGFESVTLRPDQGILTARSATKGGVITVEVAKGKDGNVKLHFDADRFHGSACVESLDALQSKIASKGVKFRIDSHRRKDRSPAFDGRRIAKVITNRSA